MLQILLRRSHSEIYRVRRTIVIQGSMNAGTKQLDEHLERDKCLFRAEEKHFTASLPPANAALVLSCRFKTEQFETSFDSHYRQKLDGWIAGLTVSNDEQRLSTKVRGTWLLNTFTGRRKKNKS